MTVWVSGGADGIAARTEDLLGVAAVLDRVAAEIEAVADWAGSPCLRWLLADQQLVVQLELAAALASVGSALSPVRIAAIDLRSAAAGLRFAAAGYERHESELSHLIGGLFRSAGQLTYALSASWWYTDSPGAALQAIVTADPQLVDAAADALLWTGLEQTLGSRYPDGHPVVRYNGPNSAEIYAPHDVQDLIGQLADRDGGTAGEVSVSFLVGADGRRRAIVDIPGTKSWSPGASADVTSLSTNARAVAGESTSYERGVLEAMDRAGVRRSDQVMLVGHSEGGMVAVTAARDAVRSGRFDVTHVVTAGSPIGRDVDELPSSVRVLALENRHDVIPALDGRANPARPNITTVGFDYDTATVSGNHSLSGAYTEGAQDVDHSGDRSIRAFTRSAGGFLDGQDERTEDFVISRGY